MIVPDEEKTTTDDEIIIDYSDELREVEVIKELENEFIGTE